MLLNVDISGKKTAVIGGGTVACRKIKALLVAGAEVHVVAPRPAPEIVQLADANIVTVLKRPYRPGDLEGMFLVVAATDDEQVNRRVASDALRGNQLVCVADLPASGNCRFPARLQRGNLEIGVSTGGHCPPLASQVRDIIAGVIGDEYGKILEQLSSEREKLLTDGSPSTYNTQVLRSLARRLIDGLTESKEPLP